MYGDDLAGYQIDDVPSVEIDDNLKQVLIDNSADSEQISLMSEAVIVVDENDVQIGPASKVAAHHRGVAGGRHRFTRPLCGERTRRTSPRHLD